MRCPDCNKFVPFEDSDPEVELDVELDGDVARVTGTVRMVRCCAECGTELKEANFDVDEEVPLPTTDPAGHELPTETDSVPHTHDLSIEETTELYESGGGRYKKNMVGYDMDFTITCSCGLSVEGHAHDELAANQWDEMA
jgi:hypothetical protein